MLKNILLLFGTILLMVGCSAVSVTNDYDPGVDFSNFKTFALYQGTINGSVLESVPLVKRRVLEAISKEMIKKGLTQADTSNADLLIYTQAGTTEKINVRDYGYHYGSWWGRYPYERNIDVSYYTQASLIIDLVSNAKDELIWRGIGTGVVQESGTPEERQQKVDEAVAEILGQYPPVK